MLSADTLSNYKRCMGCRMEKAFDQFCKCSERNHIDGRAKYCKACVKKKRDEKRAANLEEERRKDREYARMNWQKGRNGHLKRSFNITNEDYDRMYERQLGRCAICQGTDCGDGRKHFAVDHDHETGKVRALLCASCNKGLGHFKDNSNLVEAALLYLKEHNNGVL